MAIVPSAGFGKRLALRTKKPFVSLGGHPLVAYAIGTLNKCKAVDAIFVAAERPCVNRLKAVVLKYGFDKVIDVVVGGKTRAESVRNCLARVDETFDIVLIHDGARPFIQIRVIEDSIRLALKYGSCIVAVPENDTVKMVDEDLFITKTLNRSRVFRAQTPQVFRREIIMQAVARSDFKNATDDANLVEALKLPVKVLKGSYRNIKITTKEDLKFAEALL